MTRNDQYIFLKKGRFIKVKTENDNVLSVVVPIYNTENSLPRCIESILAQTYKNLDVILIDDGSTDGSGAVCDKYAVLDNRIRTVHQKNKGRTEARKTGVLLAKGDVVTFVDSDDWLEKDIYAQMMETFVQSKCDLLSAGIIRDYEVRGKAEVVYDHYPEGFYYELDAKIYPSMLWDYYANDYGILHNLVTKLFKKKMLLDILCEVDSEIFYGEDCLICCKYCLASKSIYILHKAGYHYNIHPGSTCWMADPALVRNAYLLYMGLKNEFAKYQNPYMLMRQLKRYILEVEKHSLQMLFDINLDALGKWKFDYDMSVFDSNYILYGAGACGQALYRFLEQNGKTKNLTAWIDKHPEGKAELCLHEIVGINDICNCQYEFLIIAVKEKGLSETIRKDLTGNYHIDANKIVWKQVTEESIFGDIVF